MGLDRVLLLASPTWATVGSVPAGFVVGTEVAAPGKRTMNGCEIVSLLLLSVSLTKFAGSTMTAIRAYPTLLRFTPEGSRIGSVSDWVMGSLAPAARLVTSVWPR